MVCPFGHCFFAGSEFVAVGNRIPVILTCLYNPFMDFIDQSFEWDFIYEG